MRQLFMNRALVSNRIKAGWFNKRKNFQPIQKDMQKYWIKERSQPTITWIWVEQLGKNKKKRIADEIVGLRCKREENRNPILLPNVHTKT